MGDFVVLGTDTDAGKTTFSLLWLTAFGSEYAYWKPLETGDSDTETIRRLCPHVVVHPPVMRFGEPVAPPLAARREGRAIPLAGELVGRWPGGDKPVLVETFGGPFSPLNESELQVEFVRGLCGGGNGFRSLAGATPPNPPSDKGGNKTGDCGTGELLAGATPPNPPSDKRGNKTGDCGTGELLAGATPLNPPSDKGGNKTGLLDGQEGSGSDRISSPPCLRGGRGGSHPPATPAIESNLRCQTILVSNSAIGAVGRTLGCLKALSVEGIIPAAVVLIGPEDPYAVEQINRHSQLPVFSLPSPAVWDSSTFLTVVVTHAHVFDQLRHVVEVPEPSSDLIQRDRAFVWHPYASLKDPLDPLPVISAKDEFLHLADGRRIIDATSSWWTILHGHRPPHLVAALHRAAEQLDHVIFAGATHPHAVAVAEALLRTVPWQPGGRVFFSDNGSTSVEVALKMAYQWWVHRGEPQRTLFVGFENGYHGDTFGAMAVGRDPLFFGKFEPLLFKALQKPVLPTALEDTLSRDGKQVAAVVIEPLVQGAGGMRMHSPETLAELAAISRMHGVLFIVDEVMTAGRTGTWWAHTQANIEPDLICSSKTLAGGMLPLAVTLASPTIVESFDTDDRAKTLFHGHSFTANPLACAVAAANLTLMADGSWLGNVRRITDCWARHRESIRKLPGVRDVRHQGTILAVEVDAEGGYLAGVGPRVRQFSLEHGVMLRPLGNVIYAMPPLGTSDDSLQRILEVMVKAICHLHEVP